MFRSYTKTDMAVSSSTFMSEKSWTGFAFPSVAICSLKSFVYVF